MGTMVMLLTGILMSGRLSAQVWIDIAPKGGIGLSGFYNSNVWNDSDHNNQFNVGYSYGGKLGINFGEYNGIVIEGLLTQGRQQFGYRAGDTRQPNITEWQTLDAALLYRFNSAGSYLEIGPTMSMVRNVEQQFAGQSLPTEGLFADRYFSAVAGFGGFIAGNEVFTLVAGLRLGYALTDMLAPEAAGLANPPPAPYTQYDMYSRVSPFFAQIMLEFSFGIGGTAKAACGRRAYLFGSRYR